MPAKIIFTEKQEKEIIDLYENKLLSYKETGKKFGVSDKLITCVLRKNNINTNISHRKKRLFAEGKLIHKKITFSDTQIKEIIQLYKKDLTSPHKISKRMGYDLSVIIRILKSKKIFIRPRRFYLTLERPPRLNLNEKKIILMYEKEEISGIKIAKKMGCHYSTIYDILEKNKIIKKGAKYFNKGKSYRSEFSHSMETRNKLSKITNNLWKNPTFRKKLSGKNANAYRGGKSFEPYNLEFNNKLREYIRKRDNYTCQECGKSQEELKRKLCTHHIDYNKQNNSECNLISLCTNCHPKTNFNRKHWENYFKMKMFINDLFDPENLLIFNENKQFIGMKRFEKTKHL